MQWKIMQECKELVILQKSLDMYHIWEEMIKENEGDKCWTTDKSSGSTIQLL